MYAVRKDGLGWRTIDNADECGPDEEIMDQPPVVVSFSERLLDLLRAERAARLSVAAAILDRHRNQREFGIATTLTAEQATAWAVYAQALRDLPANTVDPANPVWPEAPGAES